jgi:hypothetical protein
MPTETGRIIKRKRVKLPDGTTVDIPVITQITFLDVVNQGQESEFHIENSGAAHRDVHVASIPGGGAATDESGGGSGLKIERIEVWRVLDVVDRGQESFIHLDNKTIKEPPEAPPYFTTHEKTHVVKYINTPDDGNAIKSELIDRFKVLDTVDQGQETEYFLSNPPDNQTISGLTLGTDKDGTPTIAVDPSVADVSDSSNGIDPPWRTDPFQNIVDWGAPKVFAIVWRYICTYTTINDPQAGAVGPFDFPGTTLIGQALFGFYRSEMKLNAGLPSSFPGFTYNATPHAPTVTFPDFGFIDDPWLLSLDHGGHDYVNTGTTSVSVTAPLLGRALYGGAGGATPGASGFYRTGPTDGEHAFGYNAGVGIYPNSPEYISAGSITAGVSGSTGDFNGAPYVCYRCDAAIFAPPHFLVHAPFDVSLTAWFKPA